MIRFRNPGSQYSTQIMIFKALYKALKDEECFDIDDMAKIIAQNRLLTANGYAGDDAVRSCDSKNTSKNSVKMNAKMYAELFRMLGWVTPYRDNSSYPLVFTYIGVHVALSTTNSLKLYEQCALGINFPTQLSSTTSYVEKSRFFKCALRSFADLEGIMCKQELCIGPMSVDDENEDEYKKMIDKVKSLRGEDVKSIGMAYADLANNLNMDKDSVGNCTRFPIAVMKSCDWIKVSDKSLHNGRLTYFEITQHGRNVLESINEMYDLRLDEYMSLNDDKQNAMIRLGTYSLLGRAGYDISEVRSQMCDDRRLCQSIIGNRELLFSPTQTIRRTRVEDALDVHFGNRRRYNAALMIKSDSDASSHQPFSNQEETTSDVKKLSLDFSQHVNMDLLVLDEDKVFLAYVNTLIESGKNCGEIVDELFNAYSTAKEETFYPLIATLFKIIGFECSISRPGDNGSRWDAIIVDQERSIPIEIKSPTETDHLSIKAIRQALENKIVLLSRKTYNTRNDVSTLAIGYYMPNERAEVSRLISDIKATYGYKVGAIDFRSLLSIAISILVEGKGFEKEKLYSLEGLINANI